MLEYTRQILSLGEQPSCYKLDNSIWTGSSGVRAPYWSNGVLGSIPSWFITFNTSMWPSVESSQFLHKGPRGTEQYEQQALIYRDMNCASGKHEGYLWCLCLREPHLWALCLCDEGLVGYKVTQRLLVRNQNNSGKNILTIYSPQEWSATTNNKQVNA